jgi:hypothetical protein
MGDSMFTFDKKARTAELRSKLEAMQAKQSLALPASTTFHEVFSTAITSALRSKRVSEIDLCMLVYLIKEVRVGSWMQCITGQNANRLVSLAASSAGYCSWECYSTAWYHVACRPWAGTSNPVPASRYMSHFSQKATDVTLPTACFPDPRSLEHTCQDSILTCSFARQSQVHD